MTIRPFANRAPIRPNKPLGFELNLNPYHPYLKERGIPPEVIGAFGLVTMAAGLVGLLVPAVRDA